MKCFLLSLLLFPFLTISQELKSIEKVRAYKVSAISPSLTKGIRDAYIPELLRDIYNSFCKDVGSNDCNAQLEKVFREFDLVESLGMTFVSELLNFLRKSETSKTLNFILRSSRKNIWNCFPDNFSDESKLNFIAVLFQDPLSSMQEDVALSEGKDGARMVRSGIFKLRSGFMNNLKSLHNLISEELKENNELETFNKNLELLEEIIFSIFHGKKELGLPNFIKPYINSKAGNYHFYVNAYFTKKLFKLFELNQLDEHALNFPFLMNANYEILQDKNSRFWYYFLPLSDEPTCYKFFPKSSWWVKNMRNVSKDIYLGYLAREYALGVERVMTFEEFKTRLSEPLKCMKVLSQK